VQRLVGVGLVTLAEPLDYESSRQYNLSIGVHEATDDEGHEGQSTVFTAQLIIDVINVNDHAPAFTQRQYRVFLSEDSVVGSFVIQLVATDADSCQGNQLSTSRHLLCT